MDMETHKITANSIGFSPMAFKSLNEIVVPTKNKVKTKRRLDIITMFSLMKAGIFIKLFKMMTAMKIKIKYGTLGMVYLY